MEQPAPTTDDAIPLAPSDALGVTGRMQLAGMLPTACITTASMAADLPLLRWSVFGLAMTTAGYLWYKDGRGNGRVIYVSILYMLIACAGLATSFYLQGEHEERAARQAAAAQTAKAR